MQLVQQLISSHKIVGIQETHAKSKLEAENFFFQHVEALKFYDPTYHLVILVDRAWADRAKEKRSRRDGVERRAAMTNLA